MYQKPTEPLSIGGVLDDGFNLLKACFVKALILGAILSVLTNIPSVLMQMSAEQGDVGAAAALGFLFVASILVGVILYGALISLVSDIADGKNPTLGDACRVGLSRYFAVLGCMLLFVLIILLGYIALIIPGVILTVSLLFSNYLVVTDRMGIIEALKQSHQLVWGHWWRTTIILTILAFILMVVYLFVGILSGVGVFFSADENDVSASALSFVNLVVVPLLSAVVTPITYAFGVAIFNDLKLRKRGADLEQRIEALDTA